ncbi:permease-like cell division protein FtsX [Spirillospora sp. NPDC047418]
MGESDGQRGDTPDAEDGPRLPPPERQRAPFARPVVIVAAVVMAVLVTASAVVAGYLVLRDEPRRTSSEERDVAVYFCVVSSSNAKCRSRDAAQGEKDVVRQHVEGMAGVLRVEYESKEEAFERFEKTFADRKDLFEGVTSGDIPDSLRVRVADIEAAEALKAEVEGVPGVDTVVVRSLPPRT